MTSGKAGPVDPDVDGLSAQAARLAAQAGLVELGERLRAHERGVPANLPRVIVAGEQKRGKSSLVNALAGRPLLSPVGDEVVTATYVLVAPIEPPALDHAVVILADGPDERPKRVHVELAELADYVSVNATHEGVAGAEIMIDAPLLRGINLIDTPGVGGLQRGHGEVTMAALRTAQALLFVMDAGAPLSIPELSFLAEAARQTDTVVLVMTKIDLFPEWEKIRDDNRELIAQYAPAVVGAPILGVSSRLVEQASHLAADDSDAAKQVRAMSGLELVTDELRAKVIHRAQSRASDNRVRALRATLLDLRLQLGELPEHLANNPQRMDELVAERDRLRAFLYDPHTGVIDIHQRIHRIQRYVEREFYLQVSSLIQRYSTLVENYPSGELKEIPTLVKGELTHIIADRLDDLSKELSNIVEAVESRIGSVAVLVAVRKKFADEVEPEITVHSSAEDHPENLVAATTDAVRASSLLFIGGFFVAGPVGVAISLAATVTAGLRQFLNSKNSSRQQSLRLWLDRVERDVERVFDRACGERIDALQRALDVELPRLLEGRAKHIDRLTRSSQTSATTAVPSPADVDALLEMVGAKALVTEARSKEMP